MQWREKTGIVEEKCYGKTARNIRLCKITEENKYRAKSKLLSEFGQASDVYRNLKL